jgi:hypothetical protein
MVHTTRHLGVRMSQRGITGEMVDFVLAHGVNVQDKVILSRRELGELVARLEGSDRALALKLLDKGGVVVVEVDGAAVTAYNFDSFDRRKRAGTRSSSRRPRAYR